MKCNIRPEDFRPFSVMLMVTPPPPNYSPAMFLLLLLLMLLLLPCHGNDYETGWTGEKVGVEKVEVEEVEKGRL